MRNLKKILALVLALMMVLSMMATASAADFNDAEEINSKYADAVQVMASLGVLSGKPVADGSFDFDPKGTLRRDEAAVIISKVLEGSVESIEDLADSVDSPFVDVAKWAKNYVDAAYAHGVISGNGGNKYYPAQTLTGHQFGKMLLIAVGHNVAADFDGKADWKVTVATELQKTGLLAGVDVTLSKPLTREIASQMAFNALMYCPNGYVYVVTDVDGVEYTFDTKNDAAIFRAQLGALASADPISTVATKSLYSDVFGGQSFTGLMTHNAENDTDYAATSSVPETFKVGTKTFNGTAGLDLIGHNVTVYYYTNAYGYDVAYTIVDNATLVKEISGVYDGVYTKLADAVKGAGFKKNSEGAATYSSNYSGTGSLNSIGAHSFIMISNSSNKKVDYIIELTRTVEVITKVSTKTINNELVTTYTTNAGKYDTTEIVGDVELAKGDIIHVAPVGANGDIYYIEVAEVLTGDYTGATSNLLGTSYAFGGVAYADGHVQIGTAYNNVSYLSGINGNVTVGNTYSYVLDDYGRIAALWQVAGEDTTVGYAYLAAFGKTTTTDALGAETETLTAVLYFADGTTKVVPVDTTTANGIFTGAKYDTQDATKATVVNVGGIYKVSTTLYGYYLAAPTANAIHAETKNVVAGSNIVATTNGTANVYGNDSSVTFFVNGTYNANPYLNSLVVTVVNGVADLATYDLAEGYYKTSGGTNLYTVGKVTGNFAGKIDADIYYYDGISYVANVGKTHTTVTYTVYQGFEATTLTFTAPNGQISPVHTFNGQSYNSCFVKVNATNTNIEFYTTTATDNMYVESFYNGTLIVTDGSSDYTYYVTDNTAIYDLTEKFVAFDEDDVTIVISYVYESKNGLNLLTEVYVESIKSNDAVIEADTYEVTYKVGNDTHTIDATVGTNTIAMDLGNANLKVSDLGDITKPDGSTLYFGATGSYTNAADVATNCTKVNSNATGTLTAGYVYVVAADGYTVRVYTLSDSNP